MPITKSAKKSLKVSKTKQSQNKKREAQLEIAIKKADEKNVNSAIALIDKAAKIGIIHQNKAARLKSKLMKKFGSPKGIKKPEAKVVKKVVEKKPVKTKAEGEKSKVKNQNKKEKSKK